MTASSFGRWDWCGQRGPGTSRPGKGVGWGQSLDQTIPRPRGEAGGRGGVGQDEMGAGYGQHRLLGLTTRQTHITEGESDPYHVPWSSHLRAFAQTSAPTSDALLPHSKHLPSQPPPVLPDSSTSPHPPLLHSQPSAKTASLSPWASCYQGNILVVKGTYWAPINVLSFHKHHEEAL